MGVWCQSYKSDVATPAVYRGGGRWFLYVQAAPAGHYIDQP